MLPIGKQWPSRWRKKMKIRRENVDKIFVGEKKAIILICAVIVFYALTKSLGLGIKYQGIITALFWSLLCVYIYLNRSVRFHSKLKNKDFYIIFMAICAGLYIISYFALGIIDGFGINMYDTSFLGIVKNVLTLGSVIVFREIVRNFIINTVQKKFAIYFGLLMILVFSFAEVNFRSMLELGSMEAWLAFLSESVLPLLFFNAFMTYAAYTAGVWGPIIYATVTNIPIWIISVLPNFRWITIILVGVLFPLLCMVVLRNVRKSKLQRGKKRKKKEENPYSWLLVAVVMVALVWFSLGIFPAFPSVIVSKSMDPIIQKGDLVVMQKTDIEDIEIGDVIQYQLEDIQVVHRIIDVKYDEGVRYYVTKGDANNSEDASPVLESQVRGKLAFRIPFIGWPTLIFRQGNEETRVETG